MSGNRSRKSFTCGTTGSARWQTASIILKKKRVRNVVLTMTNCPPKLRGDLSKWLCEINTGVYVGNVSIRVRDALWERVCQNLKNGQATLVFVDADGVSHTEQVIPTSRVWVATRFTGVDGHPCWKDVSMGVRFVNAHH